MGSTVRGRLRFLCLVLGTLLVIAEAGKIHLYGLYPNFATKIGHPVRALLTVVGPFSLQPIVSLALAYLAHLKCQNLFVIPSADGLRDIAKRALLSAAPL